MRSVRAPRGVRSRGEGPVPRTVFVPSGMDPAVADNAATRRMALRFAGRREPSPRTTWHVPPTRYGRPRPCSWPMWYAPAMSLLVDDLLPVPDAQVLHHADIVRPAAVVRAAPEEITFADLPALGLWCAGGSAPRSTAATSSPPSAAGPTAPRDAARRDLPHRPHRRPPRGLGHSGDHGATVRSSPLLARRAPRCRGPSPRRLRRGCHRRRRHPHDRRYRRDGRRRMGTRGSRSSLRPCRCC
jgi:hypothetical protein